MTANVEAYAGRKPAWHGLGNVYGEVDLTAAQAAEKMGGIYDVETVPLTFERGEKVYTTGKYQMIRVNSDGSISQLGDPVNENYTVLSPQKMIDMWDQHLVRPDGSPVGVETMFILKDGEVFGMTAKLDPITVVDEEIEQYLLFGNPFDGASGIETSIVTLRVVCMNTWVAALNSADGSYGQRVSTSHHKNVESDVAAWLDTLYTRTIEQQAIITEAYNVLANHKVSELEFKWIVGTVVPAPQRPDQAMLPTAQAGHGNDIFARKMTRYGYELDQRNNWVNLITDLYEGDMLGGNTQAANGTLWGLTNAITEAYNWGGKRKKDQEVHAKSVLFGHRAGYMRRAFEAATAVSTGQVAREEMERVAATID